MEEEIKAVEEKVRAAEIDLSDELYGTHLAHYTSITHAISNLISAKIEEALLKQKADQR